MSRLNFANYKNGIVSWEEVDIGSGATGQIKKASWFGRDIEIKIKSQIGAKAVQESIIFNRGSLVDWLKSRGYKIEKGNWCCGGDDDETITKLFNAEIAKLKSPVADFAAIDALEKRISAGDTSAIIDLVTECLKDESTLGKATDQFYQAFYAKDYVLSYAIRDVCIKSGHTKMAYVITSHLAKVLMQPALFRELAEMQKKGVGTKVDEKAANTNEKKAVALENLKKIEDSLLALKKRIKDGEVSLVVELAAQHLKFSQYTDPYLPNGNYPFYDPHYTKVFKCFNIARDRGDCNLMSQIKDLFLNTKRTSEAFKCLNEIVNTIETAVEAAPKDPQLLAELAKCYQELATMYRDAIGTHRNDEEADKHKALSVIILFYAEIYKIINPIVDIEAIDVLEKRVNNGDTSATIDLVTEYLTNKQTHHFVKAFDIFTQVIENKDYTTAFHIKDALLKAGYEEIAYNFILYGAAKQNDAALYRALALMKKGVDINLAERFEAKAKTIEYEDSIRTLETRASKGDNSAAIELVTESLRSNAWDYTEAYKKILKCFKDASARDDHKLMSQIKDLILTRRNKITQLDAHYKRTAYKFLKKITYSIEEATPKNQELHIELQKAYQELAAMHRSGTGTKVDEKRALQYEEKAKAIETDKMLDACISQAIADNEKKARITALEKRVEDGEVFVIEQLVAAYLEDSPNQDAPYYRKAMAQVDQAQKDKNYDRLEKIKEIFLKAGYILDALHMTAEIWG